MYRVLFEATDSQALTITISKGIKQLLTYIELWNLSIGSLSLTCSPDANS